MISSTPSIINFLVGEWRNLRELGQGDVPFTLHFSQHCINLQSDCQVRRTKLKTNTMEQSVPICGSGSVHTLVTRNAHSFMLILISFFNFQLGLPHNHNHHKRNYVCYLHVCSEYLMYRQQSHNCNMEISTLFVYPDLVLGFVVHFPSLPPSTEADLSGKHVQCK